MLDLDDELCGSMYRANPNGCSFPEAQQILYISFENTRLEFHLGNYKVGTLFISMWWNDVLVDVVLIPAPSHERYHDQTDCELHRRSSREISITRYGVMINYENGLAITHLPK